MISCFIFSRITTEMVLSQKHCFRPCLVLLRNAHSAADLNHYKTLGLSPSATKAEIKAAYYELSKKHHPDRNRGSEASAKMFRNVKEAYEVLGNDQKRMQYDKDRIFKSVRKPAKVYYPDNNSDYKDEAEKMHFRSRARPLFRKYTYGKTTYYDFDAWNEAHYGKQYSFKFTAKYPKQFRDEFSKETEKEIETQEKIKRTFSVLLYVMLFLITISVYNSNRKRTI